MSELKPCPFCGGEAKVFGNYEDTNYHVNCTNDECGCCWVANYETEEEAIEAWKGRGGVRCCKIRNNWMRWSDEQQNW